MSNILHLLGTFIRVEVIDVNFFCQVSSCCTCKQMAAVREANLKAILVCKGLLAYLDLTAKHVADVDLIFERYKQMQTTRMKSYS